MAVHKADKKKGRPICGTWFVRAVSTRYNKDVTCKRCLKLIKAGKR